MIEAIDTDLHRDEAPARSSRRRLRAACLLVAEFTKVWLWLRGGFVVRISATRGSPLRLTSWTGHASLIAVFQPPHAKRPSDFLLLSLAVFTSLVSSLSPVGNIDTVHGSVAILAIAAGDFATAFTTSAVTRTTNALWRRPEMRPIQTAPSKITSPRARI